MQYLRPSSDVTTSGFVPSSGGDLFAMIDEVVTNDADFITANITLGSTGEVLLSSGVDPAVDTGHTLSVRVKGSMIAPAGDFEARLMQGATTIQTFYPVLNSTWTTSTFSVTNASAITDYSDLRVRLVNNTLTLQPEVSQVYLEIPDDPTLDVTISNASLGKVNLFSYDKPAGTHWAQNGHIKVFAHSLATIDKKILAEEPLDEADAKAAMRCSLSGFWFPRSQIVIVDGKPYGRRYAPTSPTRTTYDLP